MFKRIIARLDVKNDTLVKGINLEGLRNLGKPEEFAKKYYFDGIDEIHYQDVVASLYSRDSLIKVIDNTIKDIFVTVSVGGGIRNNKDIDQILRYGADKISINSAAVRNPEILKKAANVFGSSTISVNIETLKLNNKYEVFIDSGRQRTGLELFSWIDKIQKLGVGELIVTSISHEGKKNGFDYSLYKEIKSKTSVPIVAHGGAGSTDHILKLFVECNVDAVSLASIMHYSYLDKNIKIKNEGKSVYLKNIKESDKSKFSLKNLKLNLKKNGIKIRI